jgi:hypothetical protein
VKSKRPKWRALAEGGELSGAIKADADGASGAYAIRRKRDHVVLYVGESSRGRLWRTLLRHFQAPESFRKVRERGIFDRDASKYEVALWVTSKGARSRSDKAPADQRALDAQAKWIETLKPSINVDDGKADDDDLSGPWDLPGEDDGHAFASLLNPARELVELGKLTRLDYEDERGRVRALRFGLRSAPSLAYDDAGRLHVAYVKAAVRNVTAKELREYARTHWGEEGTGNVRAVNVALPPFRRLGKGLSVTYTTRKGGDGELVDYVHPWGEGARGKWAPPIVVVHACQRRCAGVGQIALRGGTYRVTERGIVG